MIYFQIFTTFRYKSLKNSEYNVNLPLFSTFTPIRIIEICLFSKYPLVIDSSFHHLSASVIAFTDWREEYRCKQDGGFR